VKCSISLVVVGRHEKDGDKLYVPMDDEAVPRDIDSVRVSEPDPVVSGVADKERVGVPTERVMVGRVRVLLGVVVRVSTIVNVSDSSCDRLEDALELGLRLGVPFVFERVGGFVREGLPDSVASALSVPIVFVAEYVMLGEKRDRDCVPLVRDNDGDANVIDADQLASALKENVRESDLDLVNDGGGISDFVKVSVAETVVVTATLRVGVTYGVPDTVTLPRLLD
jgi:hypothetical protein